MGSDRHADAVDREKVRQARNQARQLEWHAGMLDTEDVEYSAGRVVELLDDAMEGDDDD